MWKCLKIQRRPIKQKTYISGKTSSKRLKNALKTNYRRLPIRAKSKKYFFLIFILETLLIVLKYYLAYSKALSKMCFKCQDWFQKTKTGVVVRITFGFFIILMQHDLVLRKVFAKKLFLLSRNQRVCLIQLRYSANLKSRLGDVVWTRLRRYKSIHILYIVRG